MSLASFCGVQACLRAPVRPWARGSKPQSISARVQQKHHTTVSPRQLRAWSAASLQTLTVDDPYEIELSYLSAQIEVLSVTRNRVIGLDDAQQVVQLRAIPGVQHVLTEHKELEDFIFGGQCEADVQAALLATIAAGQEHVLTLLPEGDWKPQMHSLAEKLVKVQRFYDALGGIVGYQLKCLQLICDARVREFSSMVPSAYSSLDGSSLEGSSSEGSETDASSVHSAAGAAVVDDEVEYLVPQGPKFNKGDEGRALAQHAAGAGLRALPELAEIYPLGGAGDRLGLVCDQTGEPLPAAMLPYCGRPLLEGLVRDLTAREYLYYRTFGEQCITPVAIMTSDAKGNDRRVKELLETRNYFGRPKDSLRLFCQPLVPVLEASSGVWVLPEALTPSMKPGGHGAIWKLMHDNGIFSWLQGSGRTAATIRQISNPMAATDCTLLALAGTGHSSHRAFGFASCDRAVGASEGMNVLQRRKKAPRDNGGGEGVVEYEYGVTNVEYTEFTRLGIEDKAVEGGSESAFPANTNILYVGLDKAHEAVLSGIRSGSGGASLPGIIFNLNKQITYTPASPPGSPPGTPRTVMAGRMECTMQNLADALTHTSQQPLSEQETAELDTFVVFNERRYVTSSAKRIRKAGSTKVAQTPEGSFLDLMRNAADVLRMARVHVPDVSCTESYLSSGCAPAFVWLWNPAMGPLWSVVAQKVAGGSLAEGSEVELEIAELCWKDVAVDGSLLVHAENIVGAPDASGTILFSHTNAGRVRLESCTINNQGIDCALSPSTSSRDVNTAGKEKENENGGNGKDTNGKNGGTDTTHASVSQEQPCFWKRKVPRAESCSILLRGRSEFVARGVVIAGNALFEVPDGQCMEVVADADSASGYKVLLTPLGAEPSWQWEYTMHEDNNITLKLLEGSAADTTGSDSAGTLTATAAK